MKWLKSDLVQNTFAIWGALMLLIVTFHIIHPDDPWVQFIWHPLILVCGPLLLAGAWLLITLPVPDSTDDDGEETSTREKKRRRMVLIRKMALIWLVSFIAFAMPHFMTLGDPLLHNPAFLIIAPIVLAGIPWITYKE